mgnify:CR=1 FL=1
MNVKEIGMVAGGTGIAPMYQVIRAILDDPTDPTKIHLLFANRSEEDILLREELEEAAKDPRIKVHYTIDKVIDFSFHYTQSYMKGTEGWKGFTGHVNKEMLQQTMPKPSDDLLIWSCGPKIMQRLLKTYFEELGYNMKQVI